MSECHSFLYWPNDLITHCHQRQSSFSVQSLPSVALPPFLEVLIIPLHEMLYLSSLEKTEIPYSRVVYCQDSELN